MNTDGHGLATPSEMRLEDSVIAPQRASFIQETRTVAILNPCLSVFIRGLRISPSRPEEPRERNRRHRHGQERYANNGVELEEGGIDPLQAPLTRQPVLHQQA